MTLRIVVIMAVVASLMTAGCTKIVTRQWNETLEFEAHQKSIGLVTAVVTNERQVFKFNDNGGRIDRQDRKIVGTLIDGAMLSVAFDDIALVEIKKRDRLATEILVGLSVLATYAILTADFAFIGEDACILCGDEN